MGAYLDEGRRVAGRALRLAAVVVAFALGCAVLAHAQPDRPGDCAECHGAQDMLSPGHPPTVDMDAATCVACHQKGTPLALHSVVPLDHIHMLDGVTCQTCHTDMDAPGPLSTAECLACHGPLEELAARTAEVSPTNPHFTPHGPTFAACDLCHKQHEPSENFCAQCHDFHYDVP